VGVPESEQTMNAKLRVGELNREIDDLQNRIEMLTEQLALAQAAGETPNLSVRMEFNRPRFVVRFADNSDEVQIDAPLLAPLGAAARAANRIYLHGHTDAYVASDAGTALAIRRAVSVRRLLVAQDVAPERIRLFYRGAGNFIANNSTREGRAQNRRVEIELRPW
jgi:outer membrane protein OmpA-like peptidoglycan-associated protein